MSTQNIIIIAVVAVLVLIVVFVLLSVSRRKKAERNRGRANQMRASAVAQTEGLEAAEHRARESENVAEARRLEAERAEKAAVQADRELGSEQARLEDQMRTADRIDPDVNHRAKGYAPQSPTTTRTHDADPRQRLEEREPSDLAGSRSSDQGALPDAEPATREDHGAPRQATSPDPRTEDRDLANRTTTSDSETHHDHQTPRHAVSSDPHTEASEHDAGTHQDSQGLRSDQPTVTPVDPTGASTPTSTPSGSHSASAQPGAGSVGTIHPEGSVAHEDGTFTYPDGSVRKADGSTVDPGA